MNAVVEPADPDRACEHPDFVANVEVNRLLGDGTEPPVAFSADVQVRCAACGEPFRWVGCQAGMSPARPMVDVEEKTLHAPLRPASSDPDFGLGIPGFAITAREGP